VQAEDYEYIRNVSATHKRAVALLRVRNEELIIQDTLNHLSNFVDGIVAFDDASTDRTAAILLNHPSVLAVVRNKTWLGGEAARLQAETLHRQTLLDLAREYTPVWIQCADADERYIGDIRALFEAEEASSPDFVRVSLFDAYLTSRDKRGIRPGEKLLNSRRYFGVERRDIVMIFKNREGVAFVGLDAREPHVEGVESTMFYCQHYGKAISEEQWEETCSYYVGNFPWETYGQKWDSRKGLAVHSRSDFGTKLFRWGPRLFRNANVIHPI
jgi:glycosyltransferase involved in cell wall biosynthesis